MKLQCDEYLLRPLNRKKQTLMTKERNSQISSTIGRCFFVFVFKKG
jgi:hypothetical protein